MQNCSYESDRGLIEKNTEATPVPEDTSRKPGWKDIGSNQEMWTDFNKLACLCMLPKMIIIINRLQGQSRIVIFETACSLFIYPYKHNGESK